MGVKDFNKIIDQFPQAPRKREYINVMIDCSNLLTTYLMRSYSELEFTEKITFKNYIVSVADHGKLIPFDIQQQIEKIIKAVITSTDQLVKKLIGMHPSLKFGNFIFVSDPVTAYDYEYIWNDDCQMSCVNNQLFNEWLEIKGLQDLDFDKDICIRFNSKEAEKQNRVKQQSAQKMKNIKIINRRTNEIVFDDNDYSLFENSEFLDSIEDSELKRIYKILFHATYFCKNSRVMGLSPIAKQALVDWLNGKNREKETNSDTNVTYKYLLSETEADIFMKAYYFKNLDSEQTLILSNDTDYNFLFGEFDNVDVGIISGGNIIRSPFQFWSEMFGTRNKRLLRLGLCRLSAMFGNDYTCHKGMIVCESKVTKFLPMLFNSSKDKRLFEITDVIEQLGFKTKRSNLARFIEQSSIYCRKNMEKIDTLKQNVINSKENEKVINTMNYLQANMFNHIDDLALKDPDYFLGYFETLLIYTNFEHYNVSTNMLETCTENVNNMINNIIGKIGYRVNFVRLDYDECIIPIETNNENNSEKEVSLDNNNSENNSEKEVSLDNNNSEKEVSLDNNNSENNSEKEVSLDNNNSENNSEKEVSLTETNEE